MAVFQPVVFTLDDERYGLNIADVNAIENRQQVVRVPNASENIKGIINLRGDVIPLFDLRTKFKMPPKMATDRTQFIIVNIGTNLIAIEVDGVEEIHSLEESAMVTMPIIAKGQGVEYFENIAKVGDKLIILINPKKLLTEQELETVEKLVEETK